MGLTPPARAVRVMKARGQSVCGICRTTIIEGQQIGKTSDTGQWVHTACLIRRQPMIGPSSGA